jgi:rod shape determining protein RodA
MIAVLAVYLAGRRDRVGRLSTILVAGALVALPTYLVYEQPDLGTALVFVAILGGMLFLAGASLGWLGLFVGAVIAAAPLAVSLLQDYQRQRLFCFLDPYADPQGACYQLVQSLNAVGSGGWLGRGLTVGGEELRSYLPVQSSDFIFAVLAEDLGFVGGLVLLTLFGLLLWRVLLIGWQARDALGMLISVGLASMIVFQLVINVGMAIGIMPVTGIPLPLVSYGGSSMISLLFGLGILESVRMRSHKPTL